MTQWGGAVFQYGSGTRVVDVVFSENVNSGGAGAIALDRMVFRGFVIMNSLFYRNLGACRYDGNGWYGDCEITQVPGSYPSNFFDISDTLFDVDPLLADPENGDFHLLPGSPAIDAGVTEKDACWANLCWLPLPDMDFEGDLRLVDGDGFAGRAADIGADEYVPTLDELRALVVDLAATDQIDEETAIVLLTYVDDARSALDASDPMTAAHILEQMIDWLKAMEDTETTELILKKTEAVHGTFD
jgi:hypothetical protein